MILNHTVTDLDLDLDLDLDYTVLVVLRSSRQIIVAIAGYW